MGTKHLMFLVMLALLSVIITTAVETSGNTGDNYTDEFDAEGHINWGTYYDPKNEFCGKFDCYKILGFDYESFGKEHPDKSVITKRYRKLSRLWHPDKNKRRDAKERFVKISRAYEVLTDKEARKEYDFMRYNQEAYLKKYGSSVMWTYAPKSNTFLVIIGLLIAGTVISWFVQKQQWQNVADKMIKASMEDLGAGKGGTPESKNLRDRALEILKDREKNEKEESTNGVTMTSKKKKKIKLTASEKRKQQEELLRPILTQLVDDIDDFGAGYHKPTWKDLLVVKLAKFPISFGKGISWNIMYAIHRIQKIPLTDDEREVLTRRAIGEIHWNSATVEEQKEMIKRDLWTGQNMLKWEEEQEVKQWSAADRKRYNRMKKGKSSKEE
mmetsp:Transcript_5179/g.6027  ORF Transcript_5179/g.6027 Transcript_5179/m.6027 type:complete len:384 (-) Transcript_5179:100-1251(-)